jgi:hypothetical protein
MTSSLRRRFTAVLAATMLMTAGVPALAHARPHPPRASTPPGRIAYVQRQTAAASFVPQRTATV